MFPKDQIADAVPLAAAGARGDGELHISQVKSGGAALHSARDAKILHTMTRVLYSAARGARGARRAEVRRSHWHRVPSQGLDLELHEIACKQNGERDKCREQSEKAAEKERKRKKKKDLCGGGEEALQWRRAAALLRRRRSGRAWARRCRRREPRQTTASAWRRSTRSRCRAWQWRAAAWTC